MTYSTLESSVQDGRPVYKFKFIRGDDEYLYTSAPYMIGDSNGTFVPAPIKASTVKQSSELSNNGIKITLPRTNELAKIFLGFTPELQTTLTIFRSHDVPGIEVSDDRVYWKGRVAAARAEGDGVTLECEDIFTSMRRTGLRARYQKGCRHALFATGCGVNIDSFEAGATILSQSGRVITVEGDSTASLSEANYYLGGIVKITATGAMRYITGHSGNSLTLISAFGDLDLDSSGIAVSIFPGCDHTMATCKDKFNNLDNYGGYPFIPSKNPFRNSVEGSIA